MPKKPILNKLPSVTGKAAVAGAVGGAVGAAVGSKAGNALPGASSTTRMTMDAVFGSIASTAVGNILNPQKKTESKSETKK